MSGTKDTVSCDRAEILSEYAFGSLPPSETKAIETHLAGCEECRRELQDLQAMSDPLTAWPTDVLRPSASLQQRLEVRIAADSGEEPAALPVDDWKEPDWETVAPGIQCKILAADTDRNRVTMLVHLLPGASYPSHVHAGVEELHLLDGELWIDDRLLHPGDYNYGPPGATDHRVYSETGCTCVLITSPSDMLL